MERTAIYLVRIATILIIFIALSGVINAQGLTAVTGRVTDPTGAVIPGVTVGVTNLATGAAREVISNEQGIYAVTQLQPGTYNIKAELAGFKPKLASAVVLPVDQTITLNLPLEVGQVTDVVDVTASAEIVNTENAQLGLGFDSKKILDLPLNARNIVGLLGLQTGVTIDPGKEGSDSSSTAGYVNGARNDQQNIVLDGVDINRLVGDANGVSTTATVGTASAAPFTGVLPTTLDSVQEFIVQTSGQNAASGRSSGAQVQLVTKSGSNQFHGSAYEAYRSTVTTATPYFLKNYACTDQNPCKPHLIRNIPGGSFGGPILKNKLFFFGAFERRTDRSQQSVQRTVPTLSLLDGTIRYQRKATAIQRDGIEYGILTTGCGGALEKMSLLSCDTVNPAVIGPSGYLEKYRKYASDGAKLSCSDCSNFATYTFNAPKISNQNIYVSRFDYTINPKNTVFIRGTLNNAAVLGAPTFPDINNALTNYDNSKGFAVSLNSVLTPTLNNNFTAGLTREGTNSTGTAAVAFSFGPSSLFQTQGAQRRAIDTWNFVDNLSLVKGAHTWQGGVNFRFIDNNFRSFQTASPGNFSEAANILAGDIGTTGATILGRAIGATELANVSNAQTVGDAVMRATGTLNQYTVGIQFDKKGNLLPAGTPFARIIRLDEFDFYLQDNWKFRPNLSFNYGIHWGVISAPWEKNGVEVNWTQNLGDRYRTQISTPKTVDQLPLLSTQLAGRANGLPDYYAPALDNWAPRASFAYTPHFTSGVLGAIAQKGGQMVIRGGYSLTFDHTGGRLATDASASGGIGLLTSFTAVAQSFSFDGTGVPRAPRAAGTGDNLNLPISAFNVSASQNFTPANSDGGWGGPRGLQGLDSNMRPPNNHLLNFTVTKELPGGFVVEGSYVGRFARGLVGVLDLANPNNVVDPKSGMDYYTAVQTLFQQYEDNGTGAALGRLSTANVVAATASIAPIPWFEDVYGGYKTWATGAANTTNGFPGAQFANATQAFYAVLNKGFVPGPNAQVTLTNATNFYESETKQHITTNGQAQYLPLYTNVGWSNYHSGQFTIRKRFSEGYSMTANYTWSKSLDVTSAGEALGQRPGGSGSPDQIIDPYHPALNYGPSTFDRRHQFNGNFTAELPVGTGKLIGSNMGGILNQIFGGWAASGIVVATSGSPWQYGAGNRFTFHFNGQDIPVQTAAIPYGLNRGHTAAVTTNGVVTGGGTPTVYFIKDPNLSASCGSDTACVAPNRTAAYNSFMTPFPGGPVTRNNAVGPGFFNMDASVSKSFRISEGITGMARAEAFNVLNHPNFSNPGSGSATIANATNIDSTSGVLSAIGSTRNDNRIMQFTLRIQF
jgi:hypothetical protein